MKRKREILAAVILSGTVGLGAQSLFAQTAPGGAPSGPVTPGKTGPTVPQPGPTMPPQTQPTIPAQPAPGRPQTEAIPGQTAPLPGQPGTIPEIVEQPGMTKPSGMAGASSENIKKAQEALTARGLNPGSTSGTMDAKTQQALRDFQQANKLPVTGVLDQKTAQQLGINLQGEKRSLPQSPPAGTTPQPGQSDTAPKPNSSSR